MKRTIAILSTVLGLFFLAGAACAQDYPILEGIAEKVIQKYQQATCEQLWQQKSKPKPDIEERLINFLRTDPQARQYFINRVAAPVANKMFECGMIP